MIRFTISVIGTNSLTSSIIRQSGNVCQGLCLPTPNTAVPNAADWPLRYIILFPSGMIGANGWIFIILCRCVRHVIIAGGRGSAKSSQIFAPTSQVGLSAAKTRFILNFGGDRIGRNREPVSLILAKGNIAHKTKAELTARKQGEVPAIADHIVPPAFLTTQTQRDRFLTLSQELIRLDIMSNLDCDVLGRYIRSAEDWVTYGKLVKKAQSQLNKALTEDNAEKAEQYTALLLKYESLRAKAFTQCHTCASALGLTITSRCKIVVPKKDDESKENKYTGFIS